MLPRVRSGRVRPLAAIIKEFAALVVPGLLQTADYAPAVIRRVVGGRVMAEQMEHILGLVDAGRIRLHVIPYTSGAHALMEGMLSLMSFDAMAPVGIR